jgi:hypothetical protein
MAVHVTCPTPPGVTTLGGGDAPNWWEVRDLTSLVVSHNAITELPEVGLALSTTLFCRLHINR